MTYFTLSHSSTPTTFPPLHNHYSFSLHSSPKLLSFTHQNPNPNPKRYYRNLFSPICAAKSQTGPVKKKRQPSSSSSSSASRTKKKAKEVEIVDDFVLGDDDVDVTSSNSSGYVPTPLPKPPAGFVVDDHGRVVMSSNKRLATIVDPTNNFPLECVIRRIFRSSKNDECMLLCPVDTPVQILKSTNIDGWSAVNDEEVESILPAAAYALAKIHMHLVYSGFCYTARGGFCYTEDDIFDFRTDDGQDVDGLPTEGVEITCFHMDGAHYMIYTPSDPLLFVAIKDHNGQLQIADDCDLINFLLPTENADIMMKRREYWLIPTIKLEDLLEDPAVISAIDEETEFNALVEEEAALLESLLGER